MSDVFISYARQDELRAERLAHALEAQGCSVWWDRQIPFGRPFDEVIDEALRSARCVLVVWSASSVGSRWVLEEAHYGYERGILVPVSVDHAAPPIGFRRAQTADLAGWQGDSTLPAFQKLLADIQGVLASPSKPARSRETLESTNHRRRAVEEERRAWSKPPRQRRSSRLGRWFGGALVLLGIVGLLNMTRTATPPDKGANPGPPVTEPTPPLPPGPSAALSRNGQEELKRLGYYRGRIDGIWGSQSIGALQRFQRERGLEPTGFMTATVLELLREAPAPEPVPPPQPPEINTSSRSGCTVTITNPLVSLKYEPEVFGADVLQVPVGDYAVISHTWNNWGRQRLLWFKIRADGREGWVMGDNFHIDHRRGATCP